VNHFEVKFTDVEEGPCENLVCRILKIRAFEHNDVVLATQLKQNRLQIESRTHRNVTANGGRSSEVAFANFWLGNDGFEHISRILLPVEEEVDNSRRESGLPEGICDEEVSSRA
jgi:hypothetical protein